MIEPADPAHQVVAEPDPALLFLAEVGQDIPHQAALGRPVRQDLARLLLPGGALEQDRPQVGLLVHPLIDHRKGFAAAAVETFFSTRVVRVARICFSRSMARSTGPPFTLLAPVALFMALMLAGE